MNIQCSVFLVLRLRRSIFLVILFFSFRKCWFALIICVIVWLFPSISPFLFFLFSVLILIFIIIIIRITEFFYISDQHLQLHSIFIINWFNLSQVAFIKSFFIYSHKLALSNVECFFFLSLKNFRDIALRNLCYTCPFQPRYFLSCLYHIIFIISFYINFPFHVVKSTGRNYVISL